MTERNFCVFDTCTKARDDNRRCLVARMKEIARNPHNPKDQTLQSGKRVHSWKEHHIAIKGQDPPFLETCLCF